MQAHRNLVVWSLLILLSGWSQVAEAQLTREQAVDALLDPGSGVTIDTTVSSVWSPFVDFGFGAGREGLLPVDAAVDPAILGQLPFPGPGMLVATDSYFFFIDDLLGSRFQHPVRFVLVDAVNFILPTVGNGGIQVSDQGWWPVVTLPGDPSVEYFHGLSSMASDNPPGFDNPEGLVAGAAILPGDIEIPPAPLEGQGPAEPEASKACALLLTGDNGADFKADVTRWEKDLKDLYGVEGSRIKKANGGNAASKQQMCDAIDAICALDPPCDKIYVRMTSHGSVESFCLSDGAISAADLCKKFKKLAAKRVPICLIIDACHSSSLKDATHWNFPAGSSIITAAASDRSSYGGTYKDGTTTFTGGILQYAMSQCANDTTDSDKDGKVDADTNKDGEVDDCEAFEWVKKKKPCYQWTGNNKGRYPAGPPTGTTADVPNQNPEKDTVGRDPKKININVCNATDKPKTDFHLIFKGDVRGGRAGAWRSTQSDQIGQRWARGSDKVQITYDAEKDETMVCWIDKENPVAPNEYIHFGYRPPSGKSLKPLRQYWTPTTNPPATEDKTPTKETTVEPCEGCGTDGRDGLSICIMTRTQDNGGWGVPMITDMAYGISPGDIPLQELNFGSPLIQDLPVFPLFSGILVPDEPEYVVLTIPDDIPPSHVLVLISFNGWNLNSNTTTELVVFDPLPPQPTCWDCEGQALGDASGDGRSNYGDHAALHRGWLENVGDPDYVCCADYNHDLSIDLLDLAIAAENTRRVDLGVCDSAGVCPEICGNEICEVDLGETCESCDDDCGSCRDEFGDGVCGPSEDCLTVPEDCGPCPGTCGDGFCEGFGSENCKSCPLDCGSCPPVFVPAGEDCWTTECGDTHWSFCGDPIPADFFGPGSQPFDGAIGLGGEGGIDTRVRRLDHMVFPGPGDVRETPVEIVELSLVSCDPITVNFGDTSTLWDVAVTLSDDPTPPGIMQIILEHENGGAYQAEFVVKPVFTFTQVGNPGNVRLLETMPPVQFGTLGDQPWVSQLDPSSPATSCAPGFSPGVKDQDQDPTTHNQCSPPTQQAGPGFTFTWRTPNGLKCIDGGACCSALDGSCGIVANEAACNGQYAGDGTDCRDSDFDDIADINETNDCCGGSVDNCNSGTDPKNPDTDGDGIWDGEEVLNGTNPCVSDDAICSDGFCDPIFENPDGCPTDCFCGDGLCQEPFEDAASCAQDCGLLGFCGDGICDENTETCDTCDSDCGPCQNDCCAPSGTPGCSDPAVEACVCARDPFCCNSQWDGVCVQEVSNLVCGVCEVECGDGVCSLGEGEDCRTCEFDCNQCAFTCGNETCDDGEFCGNFPDDCDICGPCGDGKCEVYEFESCPEDCQT